MRMMDASGMFEKLAMLVSKLVISHNNICCTHMLYPFAVKVHSIYIWEQDKSIEMSERISYRVVHFRFVCLQRMEEGFCESWSLGEFCKIKPVKIEIFTLWNVLRISQYILLSRAIWKYRQNLDYLRTVLFWLPLCGPLKLVFSLYVWAFLFL